MRRADTRERTRARAGGGESAVGRAESDDGAESLDDQKGAEEGAPPMLACLSRPIRPASFGDAGVATVRFCGLAGRRVGGPLAGDCWTVWPYAAQRSAQFLGAWDFAATSRDTSARSAPTATLRPPLPVPKTTSSRPETKIMTGKKQPRRFIRATAVAAEGRQLSTRSYLLVART